MSERSPFSPLWPRVAALTPRLRSDAPISRQVFRGQLWYVVQDPVAGRFHRFTPAAYTLIGLMNGERTLQAIWETAGRSLGDELPSQEEVIQLLSQLHQTDLLLTNVPPDVLEMTTRSELMAHRSLLARVANPLSLRFPLFDPDRFLGATLPVFGPLYSWFGFAIWLLLVVWAAMLVGVHWGELTSNLTERVMSTGNLAVLGLVFPFVKAVHELSHGYATKKWGGEVHEMGVMLLVFMPIPYVDASASSAFREKWRRVVVGAAGMLAEVLLAALAMFVWVHAEPGAVRTVAFNAILIAGVSTVLFNGNPLLRYDGYYMFSDWLEIPNLGTRANRHLGYLIQRYLFRVESVVSPATAAGEPFWFVTFGIASFCYRLFVWAVIVLVVASKMFFVGILLALWGAILMFVRPLTKNIRYLLFSPVLKQQRGRAVVAVLGVVAAIAGLLFLVPVPYATLAEGVVWLPERSMVRAGAAGFVASLNSAPNSRVTTGQPLLTLEDPILPAKVKALEAQALQLELVFQAQRISDLVQAELTRQKREYVQASLDRAREDASRLVVLSPTGGTFVLPQAQDMPGRYVDKGTVVGYVVEPGSTRVQTVLTQADIDLVRSRTQTVAVRVAGRMGEKLHVGQVREIPAATQTLPSRALSTEGGGWIFLDPSDPSGATALQTLFQLELILPESASSGFVGRRVWIRFDHGAEPLPWRWYRALRQLFLKQFQV